MLGLPGLSDTLFIMLLALLVFGPRRLPEIGRMVGRALAEFRKASNELRRTLHTELALEQETPPRTYPALAYRTPSASPEGTQVHAEATAEDHPERQPESQPTAGQETVAASSAPGAPGEMSAAEHQPATPSAHPP